MNERRTIGGFTSRADSSQPGKTYIPVALPGVTGVTGARQYAQVTPGLAAAVPLTRKHQDSEHNVT